MRRLSDASFYPGIPIGPAQLGLVKCQIQHQTTTQEHPPDVPTPLCFGFATAVAILIVVVEQTSKAARANYPAYLRAV